MSLKSTTTTIVLLILLTLAVLWTSGKLQAFMNAAFSK